MTTSLTPEGFSTARGRGYRPDQVDRFLVDLSDERDAAWERAARLTVLANDMEAEAARARAALESLGPANFEALGPGAAELLRLAESEAAGVG